MAILSRRKEKNARRGRSPDGPAAGDRSILRVRSGTLVGLDALREGRARYRQWLAGRMHASRRAQHRAKCNWPDSAICCGRRLGARSGTGARRRRHDRNVDRGSNLRRAADAPFGHSRVAPRASDDASCRLNHPFSGCNDSLEQHRSADARPPRPSTHLTSTRCRSTCRRRRVARSSATRRSRARRSRTRASAFRSAVCAGLRPIPRTGARVSARARSRRRRANAAPRRLAAIRKERVERSSPSPAPAGRKKAAASQRPSTAGRKKSAVRKLPARRLSTPGETRTDRLPVRVPGCAYCCAAAARSFDTSFSLIRADLPERSRR
ncbi:hypothetical protein BTM_2856 [Burkholderia thailandensis 34]|nr:hypothetical protein BTM_2856 [Burkholderia thailandensis 34]